MATTADDLAVDSGDVPSYFDAFPALPATSVGGEAAEAPVVIIRPSQITDLFSVPMEEQRYQDESSFGGGSAQTRICADIMKQTDTKIEVSHNKDGSLSVCITGKRDAVKDAKKMLLQKLQQQASIEVTVPKQHHQFIIGKEGKILRDIQDKTSTNIQIPKSDDPSSNIRVSGTADNCHKAEALILDIAHKHANTDILRLTIPKAYHPLIAGFQSSNTKKWAEVHAVRVHIPPTAVIKDEITVSGEKPGFNVVVAEITGLFETLKRTCGELPVPVEKAKHKFVRGYRGSNLDEIFQKTGVYVELPQAESDSDVIILRGETSQLGEALKLLYEKASSMIGTSIKVPQWLHRHILGPKGSGIKPIRDEFPKVRINFTDGDLIEIEGPTAEAQQVVAKLQATHADLAKRLTYADVKGNPQYFRHLVGKAGGTINKIKQDTGVQITMPPNDSISDTIRIEGPPEGVAKAKAEIEGILKKLADSKTVDVIIEQRFHSQIIGPKGANIRATIEKFGGISINFPDSNNASDIVTLRGDKKQVDACEKFFKEEVKRMVESSFVLEVPLFKDFVKHIIGRGGSTLTQIRTETDTRITIPKDASDTTVIKITGTQKNAEAARDKILKIQSEQANVVSETIDIEPKFHNAIIGTKGKVVQDIMKQCGGVAISFPKDKTSPKVTVRGPADEVSKAKGLLLELANEKALNSFTLEVPVKKQFHRLLIGQGGAGVNKVKEATGVRLIFPAAQDEDANIITVIGKEASCNQAKDLILARVKELENLVEKVTAVPSDYHRHFFQRQSAVLKELTDEFNVSIHFARDGDNVTVRGSAEAVDQAIARIQEIVQDLKEQVTKTVVIPHEYHRAIVGAGGKHVQRISGDHNVSIKFPKAPKKADAAAAAAAPAAAAESADAAADTGADAAADGDADDVAVPASASLDEVVIKGKPADIEAAVAAMQALIPESEQFAVPSEYHGSIIGAKGEGARKFTADFDVQLKFPNKSEENSNFITIKGTRDNIEAAKAELTKKLAELDVAKADRELRNYKLEVVVDSKHHSSIIGKAGAGIQKLRQELDVQFDFPKRESTGNENVIIITGYQAKAEKARDVLLEKVKDLDALVIREINVDPRIHARIIGAKGAAIKALQDKYKVRVNFPKDKGSGTLTVVGEADNVENAVNDIETRVEEYMEDVLERESRVPESTRIAEAAQRQSAHSAAAGQIGFQVRNAPWDMSGQSFPELGKSTVSKAPQGAWGRK